MTLGELIDALAPPPDVLLQRQVMAGVRQMLQAEDEVREQALLSGAMPAEFRVFITINRRNRFHTRYGAVLG